MTYRKIFIRLGLRLPASHLATENQLADFFLLLHVAQVRDERLKAPAQHPSALQIRAGSGRQHPLHSFQVGFCGLQVEGRSPGEAPSAEAAFVGPGAQRVSLVAQMEMAVALAAQRRRAAGDAVLLDVAAVLDRLHGSLPRRSHIRLSWRRWNSE